MPIIGSVLYMRLPYSDDSAVMTVSFHNGVALLKNVCHPVLSSVRYKKTTPMTIFWTEMLKTVSAPAAH